MTINQTVRDNALEAAKLAAITIRNLKHDPAAQNLTASEALEVAAQHVEQAFAEAARLADKPND